MLTAPRRIAICVILLCGIARGLYPQAGPADQGKKGKADTDELSDYTKQQIAASKRQDKITAALRARDAASYRPPGSSSYWIGRDGQLLEPVEYDEHGIRKPAPRGAVGVRGFPSEAEIAAANAYAAQVAREREEAEKRQQQEREQALEQQRLAAERQAQIDARQQQEAERQESQARSMSSVRAIQTHQPDGTTGQAEAQRFLAIQRQRAEEQRIQNQQRDYARAAVDNVEKTMSTRWLFNQGPMSPIEESSVLSGARQAAGNNFEAQQRLDRVEQQIQQQRWEAQNRQTQRDMEAWKNNR